MESLSVNILMHWKLKNYLVRMVQVVLNIHIYTVYVHYSSCALLWGIDNKLQCMIPFNAYNFYILAAASSMDCF